MEDKKKCQFCDRWLKVGKKLSAFLVHYRRAHPEEIRAIWDKCQLCNKLFAPDILKAHEKLCSKKITGRPPEVLKKCDFCPRSFKTKNLNALYVHCRKAHPEEIKVVWEKCRLCEKHFAPEIIEEHAKVCKKNEDIEPFAESAANNNCCKCTDECQCQSWECEFCHQVCASMDDFLQHARQIHSRDTTWITCTGCSQAFPKIGKSFFTHKDQCSSASHHCQFCPKSFTKESLLLSHARKLHVEQVEQNWQLCSRCLEYCPKPDHECLDLTCTFCYHALDSVDELLQHVKQNHLEAAVKTWIQCSGCTELFPRKSRIFFNHKVHCKTIVWIQCEFCSHKTKFFNRHLSHMRKLHKAAVDRCWTRCPNCNIMFPDENSLNIHMISSCDSRCSFCSFRADSVQGMLDHARTSHENEVNQSWGCCLSCFQRFPKSTLLNEHKKACASVVRCQFCPDSVDFETPEKLIAHCRTYHRQQVLKQWHACESCGLHFPEESPKHAKSCRNFMCEFCNKVLVTFNDYANHANLEHFTEVVQMWIECSGCEKYLPKGKHFNMHAMECTEPCSTLEVQKKHKCRFCEDFQSNFSGCYIRHVNDQHRDAVSLVGIKCNECGCFMPDATIYAFHRKSCLRIKALKAPMKCNYCMSWKSWKCNDALLQHLNSSHREQIKSLGFSCSSCGNYLPERDFSHSCAAKELPQPMEVDQNELTESGIAPENYASITRKNEKSDCPYCGATVCRRNLNKHLNSKHLSELSKLNYLCTNCKAYFQSDDNLARHVSHCKKLACESCAATFVDSQDLRTHMEFYHSDAMPIAQSLRKKCKFCSMEFGSEAILEDHVTKIHILGDGPKYDCSFCTESFYDRNNRMQHTKHCHMDIVAQSWFGCSRCASVFATKKEGLQHEPECESRITTAKKCYICSLDFESGYKAFEHARQLHTQQVLHAWLACPSCGINYPTLSHLKKHIERSCNKFECTFCPAVFKKYHDYSSHAQETHKVEVTQQWHQCSGCRSYFPTKIKLNLHRSQCDTIQCVFCSLSFKMTEVQDEHLLAMVEHAICHHHEAIEKLWLSCSHCGLLVPDLSALASHRKGNECHIPKCSSCRREIYATDLHKHFKDCSANAGHNSEDPFLQRDDRAVCVEVTLSPLDNDLDLDLLDLEIDWLKKS